MAVFIFCSCTGGNKKALPYYASSDFTPEWIAADRAATFYQVPDFSFTDQDGKHVSKKDLDNKITVVNFFFTSCPGICKKLTASMEKVQAAFAGQAEVQLLSHSVTPERDSLPVLKKYAAEHDVQSGKWHLLTGKRNEIYSIARNGYFADEDMGWKQDSTTFLHTENILLVDGQHHIRGVYKGTIPRDVDDLINDIRQLLGK